MLRERLVKWLFFFLASVFLLSSPDGKFSKALIWFVDLIKTEVNQAYVVIPLLVLCFAVVARVCAFVCHLIVLHLYSRLDRWFRRRGIAALRSKKVRSVMRLIWVHRRLLGFLEFLSGDFSNSDYESSTVMSGLSRKSISQYVRDFVNVFISFGTLTCLACAYYLYNIRICDAKCYIVKMQNVLDGDLKVADILKLAFENLSTVATIISLISMFLYSYFRGRKWVVRKIVHNDGSESFKQAVLHYEKLCRWISCNINLFAQHFDRLIRHSKSIVRCAVDSKCSSAQVEFKSVDLETWRNEKLDTERNECLNELSDIIKALEGGELTWYARLFVMSECGNIDLRRSDFRNMASAGAMKVILLSVDTVNNLLNKCLSRSERACDQGAQKLQEDCEIELARSIYDGLFFLMRLKEAGDALKSYLHPSNVERIMHEKLVGDEI